MFLWFYDVHFTIFGFHYFIYDNGRNADAVNKRLFIGLSQFKLPAAGVNSIVWVLQSDPIAKSGWMLGTSYDTFPISVDPPPKLWVSSSSITVPSWLVYSAYLLIMVSLDRRLRNEDRTLTSTYKIKPIQSLHWVCLKVQISTCACIYIYMYIHLKN